MNLAEKIRQMIREAELYRGQGLLNEALDTYRKVEELISKNRKIKNRDSLLEKISARIEQLRTSAENLKAPRNAPEVSEQTQELIKEMFSFDDPGVKGSGSLGAAISLAEFGQYTKAREEFEALFDYNDLRQEAARNILHYGIRFVSAGDLVRAYRQWQADSRFTQKELEELGKELQQVLNEAGVKEDFSAYESENPGEPDFEAEDDDILDISEIRLPLPGGPQKGEKVELDINFQTGRQINLIIPKKQKDIIDGLEEGSSIEGVIFYSPVAIFSGSVYVVSKKEIGSGPKQGDYSMNLKILRTDSK
ncbi:MAG: hypothetical protein KGY38_00255 [Desulfobacterales bacterium]|nr:hypothetical protein [Desulfobacterales bacterium]